MYIEVGGREYMYMTGTCSEMHTLAGIRAALRLVEQYKYTYMYMQPHCTCVSVYICIILCICMMYNVTRVLRP